MIIQIDFGQSSFKLFFGPPVCSTRIYDDLQKGTRALQVCSLTGATPPPIYYVTRGVGKRGNETLPLEYAGSVLFTLKMLGAHTENGSTSSLRVIFHPVAWSISRERASAAALSHHRPCPLQQVAVSNLRASRGRPAAYLAHHWPLFSNLNNRNIFSI